MLFHAICKIPVSIDSGKSMEIQQVIIEENLLHLLSWLSVI